MKSGDVEKGASSGGRPKRRRLQLPSSGGGASQREDPASALGGAEEPGPATSGVAAAASATDAAAAAAARRARRKLIRSMAKNSPYNRRGSLEMVASSSAAAAAATRLVGPSPEEWKQCRHDRDREHLARWYDRLRELEAYRDLHGNCNVPAAYPTNQTLANWVVYLRHQKKAYDSDMKTRLTAEKVRHLEDLGFVWELRKQEILDRWSKLSEEKPGEVYLRKPKKPKTEERFDAV